MQIKSVFMTALAWQAISASVCSGVLFLILGKSAAISALLGGFSVVLGASFASLIYIRNNKKKIVQDSASILTSLLLSEMAKIIFIFAFLLMVFKHYKSLVPVALIIGLISAAFASGAAISKIEHK